MYMVISVDEFFMSGLWPFKLPERKREETDILRDIIEELQEEVAELKMQLDSQAAPMTQMAVWKCSSSSARASNTMKWDIEVMPPTIKGMAHRANSNREIVIGMHGWYRVSIRFGWSGDSGAGYQFYLQVNGTNVATCRNYYSIGFTMVEVLKLKPNDKLTFKDSSSSSWDKTYNNFTLELLPYSCDQ